METFYFFNFYIKFKIYRVTFLIFFFYPLKYFGMDFRFSHKRRLPRAHWDETEFSCCRCAVRFCLTWSQTPKTRFSHEEAHFWNQLHKSIHFSYFQQFTRTTSDQHNIVACRYIDRNGYFVIGKTYWYGWYTACLGRKTDQPPRNDGGAGRAAGTGNTGEGDGGRGENVQGDTKYTPCTTRQNMLISSATRERLQVHVNDVASY